MDTVGCNWWPLMATPISLDHFSRPSLRSKMDTVGCDWWPLIAAPISLDTHGMHEQLLLKLGSDWWSLMATVFSVIYTAWLSICTAWMETWFWNKVMGDPLWRHDFSVHKALLMRSGSDWSLMATPLQNVHCVHELTASGTWVELDLIFDGNTISDGINYAADTKIPVWMLCYQEAMASTSDLTLMARLQWTCTVCTKLLLVRQHWQWLVILDWRHLLCSQIGW